MLFVEHGLRRDRKPLGEATEQRLLKFNLVDVELLDDGRAA